MNITKIGIKDRIPLDCEEQRGFPGRLLAYSINIEAQTVEMCEPHGGPYQLKECMAYQEITR